EPVLRAAVDVGREGAENAAVLRGLRNVDETLLVRLRRRLHRTVVEMLVENGLRSAGNGASCTLSLTLNNGTIRDRVSGEGSGRKSSFGPNDWPFVTAQSTKRFTSGALEVCSGRITQVNVLIG